MEIINGTLRMTSDRLLIRPLEWEGEAVHGEGTRIAVVRHGRPLRGVVMAVGPGHYPIRYRRTEKGPKGRMVLSRTFRPTEVQIGSTVELGGLNAFDGQGYQFTEVMYNGEKCLICQERDVALIHGEDLS